MTDQQFPDQQFASDSFFKPEHPAGQRPPVCPKCERRMAVKAIVPVLFASDHDDVTYGCARCSVEMKRTVKRI